MVVTLVLVTFLAWGSQAVVFDEKGDLEVASSCIILKGKRNDLNERLQGSGLRAEATAAWLAREVNRRLAPDLGWKVDSDASPCAGDPRFATTVELSISNGAPPCRHCPATPPAPGSFQLCAVPGEGRVLLDAPDAGGLRAGAGRLLRELHLPARGAEGRYARVVPNRGGNNGDSSARAFQLTYDADADARWPVRSHQIPAQWHAVQFRTVDEYADFAADLGAFGATQLENAHVEGPVAAGGGDDGDGDDDNSAAGPCDNLVTFSGATAGVGLRVSVWVDASVFEDGNATASCFAAMPALDSLFLPGGDGGVLDWSLMEVTASLLHAAHPASEVWVSAQELAGQDMALFWANASAAHAGNATESGGWLTGVVYGPHTTVDLLSFATTANGLGLPVRDYPDITHTLSAQFALSGMAPAWSMTHGRQGVMPLPVFEVRRHQDTREEEEKEEEARDFLVSSPRAQRCGVAWLRPTRLQPM